MLNYIWAAMLVLGIAVALTNDISDTINDKYKNDDAFVAEFKQLNDSTEFNTTMFISKDEYLNIYNENIKEDLVFKVKLTFTNNRKTAAIYFKIDDSSPKLLKEMAAANGNENDLSGTVQFKNSSSNNYKFGTVKLKEVSFIGLKSITDAVIDYSKIAINIAIGLIGIMALWLGIMKIAEEAGIISSIAKLVRPITKFLFPQVPSDHPAIGAMVMNISANMLGLGNAATPFGLKAMEELDKLNENKGTATNAMCMFLAINTAGLTLIPATAIAIRSASGSNDPTIIIGTSIFGALCATVAGIISAKVFELFSSKERSAKNFLNKKVIITATAILLLIFSFLILPGIGDFVSSALSSNSFTKFVRLISLFAIPLFIIGFVSFGLIKKVKVYESFVEGAKEGLKVAVKIIPYLVGMLVAIGVFRAGGGLQILTDWLSPITSLLGMPSEVMPMALMRPLSGSGSIGIMTELMSQHGPDSFIGVLASTILGSTETTFYVLAIYFGSVQIRKTRHAVAVGVIADIVGILAALFIVKSIFG